MATELHKFPPIEGVRWFNVAVLVLTPLIAICGLVLVPLERKTVIFACAYYLFSMIGITAGYHRLWSHRSYNACLPLQIFLMLGGISSVQGSCYFWARGHRSHHRWTDTEKDPYDSSRGLVWTHVGWILFKSKLRSGPVDSSDLRNDPFVQWTHHHYFPLAAFFGYALPALIPALWNDPWGGFCFSAAMRLTIAHHCTFAINSIAHYLGTTPYDDRLSPRDHFLSAILTMGEGYHNFHHQFPMDYRNAYLWYQYDPTKWFIAACKFLGLASNLRVFPSNEIAKGALTMKLKHLKQVQESITWPRAIEELPIVTWEDFQEESKTRPLLLVSGFIHDVSTFLDQHPGGESYLTRNSGKDMTASFFGGVYRHSNAAHNLMSMMRVGVLVGGGCPPDQATPPSQILYVATRHQDDGTISK
ncbi:delta 9-fatty acid desaturase protein [Mycena olivaceomarginata]|uniref:Acyl-CoA desaturase n=1 Tax=Mycena albidolilacea TaxID=1033008 RepID=A0AAD6ZEH1_9AGAR|nr:delta 9-fatty acid desaturase protein [Mycena albidolilacea]KAJ7773508.1 delta 9-fatty acid desaturase protein [Mycena olivaceomarginata]